MVSRQSDLSRRSGATQPRRALSFSLAASGPDCLDTSPAARRRFVMPRKIDLTGVRFGILTVLREDGRRGSFVAWQCQCDCGNVVTVGGNNLRQHHTTSCGCRKRAVLGVTIDIAGQRFGRLVAIRENGRGSSRETLWLCRCDCGAEITTSGTALRTGHTSSCGCAKREQASALMTTHGRHGTRAYRSWQAMHQRCSNPKTEGYEYWGGRGIRVCERWQTFENFYADMGDPPAGYSLDRIAVDGNYEPGNCRWASATTQARNTRRSKESAQAVELIAQALGLAVR